MKKTSIISASFQGDNMKKRTLIVVALAIVLALSFTTIATAKYAGAFRGETTSTAGTAIKDEAHGYLSWDGANTLWKANTGSLTDQVTAHGGYQTSSVKCAACHSAHRAAAAPVGQDWHLTMGNGTCTNCHATWGGGGAKKVIEWANPNGGTANPGMANGGPHNSFNCTRACHTGGIHGDSSSDYNGVNAFLLGADKDAAIAAALAAGNVSNNLAATGTTGAGWFVGGTTGTPANGEPAVGTNDVQFAAAKAMATGYTCNQSGCHTNSTFAVNSWGYGENQLDAVNSNPVKLTGHGTGAWGHNGGQTCGPCHPGGASGGYRYAGTIAAANPARTDAKTWMTSQSYGCDQCHDMVGVATNTTAWPHANRLIEAYEWDATGTVSTVVATSGNLWMYDYTIGTTSSNPGTMSATDRDNSFTLVTGAVGGAATGNIRDGVCLKCHVPADAASADLENAKFPSNTSPNLNVSGRQHNYSMSTVTAGEWLSRGAGAPIAPPDTATNYTGSKLIYLFK